MAQTYKCISPNMVAAYPKHKHIQREEKYV